MKRIYSKLVLVSLLIVSVAGPASARECIECKKANAKKTAVQTKAAACKRAQSTAELNINNVRALINGYGNMWYDGAVTQYHLPKNSNSSPLYCAALWIGGTDVNDQLRIAALRFGSEGDDYWPGPLKIDGTASIDLPVCNRYDKHWIITKSDVLAHKEHFIYGDGTVTVNPEVTPAEPADVIANWPAHGDGNDLSHYLAPFYDADGDGEYNPNNGDYPYYDFDNDLCPRTLKALHPDQNTVSIPTMETEANIVTGGILSDQVLKGDQTIWWVFNDMGNSHTETNGQPIGLEIRAQAFAFSTNDEINNMTFYSYEIINRSTYELRDTYFSQWVDPDLGYGYDDYIGCDVRRGLGYCYNGKSQDTPGSGSYSGIPPAVGIDFFQGPYMDPDGKDNPKINIPWIQTSGTDALRQLLDKYKRFNADGSFKDYDTIQISYDADLFFAIDYRSWYFQKGDAVGNCAINGVNFGNNIIDDERFGMRRFVYYDNSTDGTHGEPSKANDYYNYLRGYWKNGQRMKYGGNAVNTGTTDLVCDFMFPDDSDPWHWGTDGEVPSVNPDDWNEINAGNNPGDRRFMQSAGPFTLKPGALNYITVGIPFAQASSGDQWSSVSLLRQIDDVCQALFENCFKVLDGPDAPTLTAQEMNNEVILYLSYENPQSNNFGESYSETDVSIVSTYTDANGEVHQYDKEALKYKFEGYQIFQLKDASCSVADIYDPTKSALVAQCDIENYYDTLNITPVPDANGVIQRIDTEINASPSLAIGTLVNYTTNSETGILSGQVMVKGANKGIQHVFRLTTDAFASGTNKNLVNNREYYYVAVAYAHNRYKEYSQTDAAFLDGQKQPYLAGRKNERGGSITPITVIPHAPVAENGGTMAQAEFGMCPNIIRLGGHGNGGNILRLADTSLVELMGAPGQPAKAPGTMMGNTMNNPCIIGNPTYEENAGPVNVRVIDPLKLKEGRFNIMFKNKAGVDSTGNSSTWYIVRADGKPIDSTVDANGTVNYRYSIPSDVAIGRYNEQIFFDLGIAVTLFNPDSSASEPYYDRNNEFIGGFRGAVIKSGSYLGGQMTFSNPNTPWLSGVPDNDSYFLQNWVRSGTQFALNSYKNFTDLNTKFSVSEPYLDEDYFRGYKNKNRNTSTKEYSLDKDQEYENVVNGLWAPYGLTSINTIHPGFSFNYYMADEATLKSLGKNANNLERQLLLANENPALCYNDMSMLPSVRIVFTADTTKWTRCPVIEMCDDYTQAEGKARRFSVRGHASVNKEGKTCEELGIAPNTDDPNNPAYIDANGMGWFPGYAINTVTGERLNIMFGEDSRYSQFNGRDMMWNPVGTMTEGTQNYVMGGRHYIYVMNSGYLPFYNLKANVAPNALADKSKTVRLFTPSYDGGRWARKMLGSVERLMTASHRMAGVTRLKNGLTNRISTDGIPVRDSIAFLYSSVAWVNMPLVSSRYQFDNPKDIPCDVTVDIDIRHPYGDNLTFSGTNSEQAGINNVNNDRPAYQFVINSHEAVLHNVATSENARQEYIDSLLAAINVVPNPSYSYSKYETASQLETKVRIVNLPTGIEDGKYQGCLIRIYTVDGTLVRTLGPTPVNATTIDWDLHNQTGIPIAGGMYLIHVSVPGIGERVIKWFGTMRPVDLNSFQF